ncbi:MAG TPA: PIG-L family deacetylase [Chloroflexi bacterium]|nr:PIG-L family deacetylase [Chloroflexota bacterium]
MEYHLNKPGQTRSGRSPDRARCGSVGRPATAPQLIEKIHYGHIYLSPHLDDAVLSCGGRIWQQARAGEPVLVVTVFAGAPENGASLSAFARQLHARWETPSGAVERRREEDRAALAILGADGVYWDYPECIYRRGVDARFLYDSEDSLWGPVDPGEGDLANTLARQIERLPVGAGRALYGPLGVGGHVDHQIVRRALASARLSSGVVYYEDYPYAAQDEAVREAVGETLEDEPVRWRAERVALSEEAMRAKVAAIAQYRSQLSTFWTSETEMESAIRAFAVQAGGGRPAERYWRARVGPAGQPCGDRGDGRQAGSQDLRRALGTTGRGPGLRCRPAGLGRRRAGPDPHRDPHVSSQ